MIRFYQYFTPALLLLLAEGFIERYVHDNLIRPYVGDLLVVVLIYCLIKSFLNKFLKPPFAYYYLLIR